MINGGVEVVLEAEGGEGGSLEILSEAVKEMPLTVWAGASPGVVGGGSGQGGGRTAADDDTGGKGKGRGREGAAQRGMDKKQKSKGDFALANEALRLEHRHLDLRRGELQRNLRLRSEVSFAIRAFLRGEARCVEVETPTLFRTTPEAGGAREFIVPTRAKGQFFALPQSPQQVS